MATKINDGLFIGDAEASQDPEFIELNKITFVINCAGRQLPNLWEQHGLHYLTFPWTSDPDCTLFDGGNVVIEQVRRCLPLWFRRVVSCMRMHAVVHTPPQPLVYSMYCSTHTILL